MSKAADVRPSGALAESHRLWTSASPNDRQDVGISWVVGTGFKLVPASSIECFLRRTSDTSQLHKNS